MPDNRPTLPPVELEIEDGTHYTPPLPLTHIEGETLAEYATREIINRHQHLATVIANQALEAGEIIDDAEVAARISRIFSDPPLDAERLERLRAHDHPAFDCWECAEPQEEGAPRIEYGIHLVCSDCADNRYFRCRHCGVWGRNDDQISYDFRGRLYCEDCYGEVTATCADCDRVFRAEDAYSRGGESFCPQCWETANDDDEEDQEGIHSHDFKPTTLFYRLENETLTPELYFTGFELEIENCNEAHPLREIPEYCDSYWRSKGVPGFAYCKYDGSLNNGCEIVSHPFSWAFFLAHQKDFSIFLGHIRVMGFRSQNTRTCGLHIHTNKSAWSSLRLYKLLKFFYENPAFIYAMSGRRSHKDFEQWARVDDDSTPANLKSEAQNKCKQKFGRYWAVNLENRSTIEIRIFKGTLREYKFFRAFEFLRSLYEYTDNGIIPVKKITQASYRDFIARPENKDKFPNVYDKLWPAPPEPPTLIEAEKP